MRTAYSVERAGFSKAAHVAAQTQFYPLIFPGAVIEFEDTVGTVRDLEYAIDCQLAVTVPAFQAPIRLSVQERWREDLDAMRWGDITITEWNLASDTPSELHKLAAQLFVYGFYDLAAGRILAGVAVDVATVAISLANGSLPFERRPRIDQRFICVRLKDLRACGAVIHMLTTGTPSGVLF